MKARTFALGLALAGVCTSLAGCETLRQRTRQEPALSSSADDAAKPAGSGVGEVQSEAPKGFFKSSHLPGALSSEGREIERNLGIQ